MSTALIVAALLDPARGSLSLLGAVVGGTLSGAYIARILSGGRPDWRRWLEVAAPLLLFLIAGAKFSQFLGGGGQGLPWSAQQAVAFLGPGPWQSIAPAMPSVPSQLLEGVWVAFGVLVLAFVARRARFGTVFLWALVWWLGGRIVIAFTWRDQALIGPLAVEQALAIGVLRGRRVAAGPRTVALAACRCVGRRRSGLARAAHRPDRAACPGHRPAGLTCARPDPGSRASRCVSERVPSWCRGARHHRGRVPRL